MPDHYDDPEENEDPFASGPTDPQPGDDAVNPFDPDDPFASGPTPAQPGDEDVNPFASNEPMEEGLEDIDDDDSEDEEEKKPPMQRRVARKKPRLPGAKGPLAVDSVGDYLEDVDWTEIDSQARQQAEENYPEENTKPEPPPEPEPEPQPEQGEERISFSNEKPESLARQSSTVSGDVGPAESESYYSAPSQGSIVPVGPPATSEHLQKQREVDLADYGSQGPSSFSQPGHNQTAKEDAVERATDAINTATGKIVDTLAVLAQVMNSHSHRIAQIEDQLDMESERDVS